ncbi:SRPBCC family protein [Schlesneria paludicola]|uniref:SRPBCC family protein n=1 Tax=Schlesneria paludicola TaxID=360056 RepID=UPI00029A28B1|nr:SRPBCC family protein [Schlesneria paludicola]
MTLPLVIVSVLSLMAVVLAVIIATRPDTYRVERTEQVHAPCDVVFRIINDLKQWRRWSPYDKRDPEMKVKWSGADQGPGAIYDWNGNKDVGEGRLTIVDSKPNEYVAMKLEISRPFKCENDVKFALVPNSDGTRVSWILDGKNNLISKAFSLIVSMDKMVGKDFEEGLSKLNSIAQSDVEGLK